MLELMAFAGTNHENGIYAALAFRPDIVVMMSDGGSPELNKGQIQQIARTAGKAQIHTMRFGTGAPQGESHFLQQLAEATSGSYRYIDVRSWRRRNDELN